MKQQRNLSRVLNCVLYRGRCPTLIDEVRGMKESGHGEEDQSSLTHSQKAVHSSVRYLVGKVFISCSRYNGLSKINSEKER